MSAMLTTTMPNMKVTLEVLKEAGVRDGVKVMIGGAPLTRRTPTRSAQTVTRGMPARLCARRKSC